MLRDMVLKANIRSAVSVARPLFDMDLTYRCIDVYAHTAGVSYSSLGSGVDLGYLWGWQMLLSMPMKVSKWQRGLLIGFAFGASGQTSIGQMTLAEYTRLDEGHNTRSFLCLRLVL